MPETFTLTWDHSGSHFHSVKVWTLHQSWMQVTGTHRNIKRHCAAPSPSLSLSTLTIQQVFILDNKMILIKLILHHILVTFLTLRPSQWETQEAWGQIKRLERREVSYVLFQDSSGTLVLSSVYFWNITCWLSTCVTILARYTHPSFSIQTWL